MKPKVIKNGLKLFLILFISMATVAQEKDNELAVLETLLLNDLISNDTYFFDGEVMLKNNEILSGQISVNSKNNGTYGAIFKSEEKRVFIPNDTIEGILIARENENTTRFVAINDDGKLYREVFLKDENTAIYDTAKKPFDGLLIGEVIVKDEGRFFNTYDFWSSGPKKGLINYLRQRDDVKYKRRDFTSIENLFAIL